MTNLGNVCGNSMISSLRKIRGDSSITQIGLFIGFCEAVDDCSLVGLPLAGYPYTWFRSKGSINVVEERLDRVVHN